jgi:hypothetical protein
MSARSHQVRALARDLSARAGARVEIRYDRPGEWFAEWNSGPSLEQMSDLITQLLRTGRYPDLQAQKIGCSRHCSPAAWAARAVAAHRDGTLAHAVAEGAAYRRGLGAIHPSSGMQQSPEYFALLEHVGILILTTAWPERPSDPADEPVIERLLTVTGGSESRMAELLLAEDTYVLTGEDLPGVTSLHRRRRH